MVKPASSLLFIASAASLLLLGNTEARDLKIGKNSSPSRRSAGQQHAEVAHRFAARLKGDDEYNTIPLSESEEGEDTAQSGLPESDVNDQIGLFSNGANLHILSADEQPEQHEQSKRQASSSLLPSRNTKCANLRIPAFDASLMTKVKNNLAATGGDSWVSGTR